MASQDNINLIRRLFEIYNKNDLKNINKLDELLATNLQLHDPAAPHPKPGAQGLKLAETAYIKAFPNKVISIDQIFPADNRVVVIWTAKGTQKGEFEGIAPTNKEIKISGISIYTINNNKISEIYQIWDQLGLLEQIGEIRHPYAVH